jgi:hypothetical protein
MFLQESDGSPVKELKLVKPEFILHDDTFWNQQVPTTIPALGLQDIKWKELHHKWAKFVLEEKKQQWKYYNEAPPPELIKAVAKQSKRARQRRQSRGRTVHHGDGKKPKLNAMKEDEEPPSNTGAI